jgi:hypothetical protein
MMLIIARALRLETLAFRSLLRVIQQPGFDGMVALK